jgi:hypothetical protein
VHMPCKPNQTQLWLADGRSDGFGVLKTFPSATIQFAAAVLVLSCVMVNGAWL